MAKLQKATNSELFKSMKDVIYHRRAVRDYRSEKINQATIHMLLEVAVQAPTAMHEEPWSFVVIQDINLLNSLSDSAKAIMCSELQGNDSVQAKHMLDFVSQPDFHVFYNASTLIVIYSKIQGQFVVADCWLAAENMMLAASAKGLGTCVIGFAVSALNTPEWKTKLDVPAEMTAIAPILVGVPAGETPPVTRKQPLIISWK